MCLASSIVFFCALLTPGITGIYYGVYASSVVFFCHLLPTWYQVRRMYLYVPLVPMLQVNLIREYHFPVFLRALLPIWYQV